MFLTHLGLQIVTVGHGHEAGKDFFLFQNFIANVQNTQHHCNQRIGRWDVGHGVLRKSFEGRRVWHVSRSQECGGKGLFREDSLDLRNTIFQEILVRPPFNFRGLVQLAQSYRHVSSQILGGV